VGAARNAQGDRRRRERLHVPDVMKIGGVHRLGAAAALGEAHSIAFETISSSSTRALLSATPTALAEYTDGSTRSSSSRCEIVYGIVRASTRGPAPEHSM